MHNDDHFPGTIKMLTSVHLGKYVIRARYVYDFNFKLKQLNSVTKWTT